MIVQYRRLGQVISYKFILEYENFSWLAVTSGRLSSPKFAVLEIIISFCIAIVTNLRNAFVINAF